MIQQFEKEPKWYETSILFKLGVITLLILLLLIPTEWILDLVAERQQTQQQNISTVSNNWSGSQVVQGPVLVLPYRKQTLTAAAGGQIGYIYMLPQNLHIKAGLKTEPYKKGLVNVTVYSSKVDVQGNFNQPDLSKLGIDPSAVLYDKARLVFSISDLKGLKNNPAVKVKGQSFISEPTAEQNGLFKNALQVTIAIPQTGDVQFSYLLDIEGSNDLDFLHIGKTTDVEMTGNWASPVYNGRNLPDDRSADSVGFYAKWHLLYYNRPFPQQWVDDVTVLDNVQSRKNAVSGVRLQVPIDEYRKITRTAKYSTLIILLTFVSLFLTELIRKQRIHLFNYTLIGAAMIVYYTLLLSFAEKIGYNFAYLISSVSTIALISVFTASLLANKKAAGLFATILSLFYGFVFIMIQLEDYALLVGSIALFVIVGALMYFSRKINWDNH